MLNSETLQRSLEKICPEYKTATFLLAISGGADSMVLLYLCKSLGLQIEVAHVNYKLRTAASDNDQQLVAKICRENSIPFHLYTVSEKDHQPQNSIQDWARILRYNFFRRIKKDRNLDFMITAHHLNDQLETFIIHLSKAAGIKGLSGIPSNENKTLRPLLNFSKEQIYACAEANQLEFREDLSNQKNDYLRNRIRNEIVPKLLKVNENFLTNFAKSIFYLNQTKDFVAEKVSEIENEIISKKENFLLINKHRFLNEGDFVQFEILRKYGFNDREEILKIKKAKAGKKFISREFHLTIDREIFIIEKVAHILVENLQEEFILKIDSENQVIIPDDLQPNLKELGKINWKINAEKITCPLKLRRKKDGDIFHPLGMIGKKKISKFCKDEKIPILAQQKIWLLCDYHDHILGVMPFRQDRRYAAVTESSEIINVRI